MKKQNNLSALGNKIAHKSMNKSINEKFDQADQILGIEEEISKEKIIRKSYALTKYDVSNIKKIQEKCLNKRIVLNDSHIIRIALMLTSKLDENELINASIEVPKLIAGRPKKS